MSKTGKSFWGPPTWHTIHAFAAAYTPSQREHFKAFIYSMQYTLPCDYCRQHLTQNLRQVKIDEYLDNNHNLFLWSYILHDLVNKQLGKTSPPYDVVKTYYFKGMGPECKSCKLD